jgi:hypothetical protein
LRVHPGSDRLRPSQARTRVDRIMTEGLPAIALSPGRVNPLRIASDAVPRVAD